MSLGLWMTLISYSISIPLGIAKAVRDGTRFDSWNPTSSSSAMRSELFVRDAAHRAVLRRLVLAGFPLRGLTSDNSISSRRSARSAIISGTSRCRCVDDAGRFRHPDFLTKNPSSTKYASNMCKRRA